MRFTVSTVMIYASKTFLQKHIHSDISTDIESHFLILKLHRLTNNYFAIDSKAFELYFWGIIMGLLTSSYMTLQQVSLVYIDATKAAFITSLFVIATPILEYFLQPCLGISAHLTWKVWLAAIVSGVGMYYLSGCGNYDESTTNNSNQSILFGYGEILVFVSMIIIAIQIVLCDTACKKADTIALCYVEFFVSAILTTLLAIYMEPSQWWGSGAFSQFTSTSPLSWYCVLIVSFTEASGMILASLGQMHTAASRSAIIYTFEGVNTAVLAYVLLHERQTYLQIFGCALVFTSTIATAAFTTSDEEGDEREILPQDDDVNSLETESTKCDYKQRNSHVEIEMVSETSKLNDIKHKEYS